MRLILLTMILAVGAGELYVASHHLDRALPSTCADVPPSPNLEPLSFLPPLRRGETAPNFALNDTDGNIISLADLRGKIVVLNFMGTWCQSCLWELDSLIRIHGAYSDGDVVFLSVAIEPVRTVQDVAKFKSRYCTGWRYSLDDGRVFSAYRIQVLPTTYVIDQSGAIAYGRVGVIDPQELSSILDELNTP